MYFFKKTLHIFLDFIVGFSLVPEIVSLQNNFNVTPCRYLKGIADQFYIKFSQDSIKKIQGHSYEFSGRHFPTQNLTRD